MHRHIYDVNLGWGQFLDFYSDLNNARKESDEKYVEKNYIGEEIPEPDEQPIQNNDLLDNYDQYDDGYGKPIDYNDGRSERSDSILENFNNMPGGVESSAGDGKPLLLDLQNEIQEEEKKQAEANPVEDGGAVIQEEKQGNGETEPLIVPE